MIELISYQTYISMMGDKVTDNASSRVARMMSPYGFGISLIQRIRKEESSPFQSDEVTFPSQTL